MTTFVCTGNAGKIREYWEFLRQVDTTPLVGIRDLERESGITFEEPEEDYNFFLGNAFLKLFSSLQFLSQTHKKIGSSNVNRIIVDDSGLCAPGLNYEPGVHSAYYGGLPRDPVRNREVLRANIARHPQRLSRNAQSGPEERLPALFVCFLLSLDVPPEIIAGCSADFSPRSFVQAPLEQLEQSLFDAIAARSNWPNSGGTMSRRIPLASLLPGKWGEAHCNVHFGFCLGEISTVEQSLIPDAGHGYDCMFYSLNHPELSFASVTLEKKNRESHRAFAMMALAGGSA